MGERAYAFRVKASHVVGFELACDRCAIVLQITHDPLEPFPHHRCGAKQAPFSIIMQLDSPVTKETRIDNLWHSR